MQISELARQTAVSVHALRHYERLGLIHPDRRANGYRDYPPRIRREVVFIAMSRQLGFSLPQISGRLDDYRAGTLGIEDMVQALRERADAIDQQINQLQAQKTTVLEHQAWLRGQLRRQLQPQQVHKENNNKSTLGSRNANGGPNRAAPWPRVRSAASRANPGEPARNSLSTPRRRTAP